MPAHFFIRSVAGTWTHLSSNHAHLNPQRIRASSPISLPSFTRNRLGGGRFVGDFRNPTVTAQAVSISFIPSLSEHVVANESHLPYRVRSSLLQLGQGCWDEALSSGYKCHGTAGPLPISLTMHPGEEELKLPHAEGRCRHHLISGETSPQSSNLILA